MKKLSQLAMLLTLAGLAACSAVPTSIVQQPTSARPVLAVQPVLSNGSIFQAQAYRPLFEDRRARMVGDILTITIAENTSAVKAAASSASKTGSATYDVSKVVGLPLKFLQDGKLTGSSATKFEDKGAESSSNTFTGTISVTVVEVLANGNMVVSGEKQVGLDKGVEFVRFSGIVAPDTIGIGNAVSSSHVADARVEYRTNSQIDRAEFTSMLSRLFLSVMPF